MTLKFAKKLPTLGIHYKAIPDPEPTLPESYYPIYPIQPKESTHQYLLVDFTEWEIAQIVPQMSYMNIKFVEV